MTWYMQCGDCREVMRELNACSVDSVVTDPPYGLSFMGREWDQRVPGPEYWIEALCVAKPGAHLAAFGGTRTYHRLACAIEDAGWELRDTLMWMYGQGFPKSHNIDDERGTALKPAWEPIILARKPLEGTVEANVRKWGTGALNIGACRIEGGARPLLDARAKKTPSQFGAMGGSKAIGETNLGRWPANVILDEEAGAALDEQTGVLKSGDLKPTHHLRASENVAMSGPNQDRRPNKAFGGDSGGASRFFYCAKASRSEREAGLDGFEAMIVNDGREASHDTPYQRGDTKRKNTHPTVKPIELMRWIIRLITPPGGVVLDPFAGSGTTGIAAVLEGRSFHGIDINPLFARIADARIAHRANDNGAPHE